MYISIEGNIGSGKSTIVPKLAKELGWEYLDEGVETKPEFQEILQKFYDHPEKYAYELQKYRLQDNLTELDALHNYKNYVVERSLISDAVFITNHYRNGNIMLKDFKYLIDTTRSPSNLWKNPDIIVYIKSTTDFCYENIKKRGRKQELNISKEYVNQLNHAHDLILPFMHSEICPNSPFIIVEANEETGYVDHIELADKIKRILYCR